MSLFWATEILNDTELSPDLLNQTDWSPQSVFLSVTVRAQKYEDNYVPCLQKQRGNQPRENAFIIQNDAKCLS